MFKTILVPIKGDEGDKASLGTAFVVATLFGSHIDVVHIRNELPLLGPATSPNSPQMIAGLEYVSALRECSEDRRNHARREYRQFCASATIPEMAAPHKTKSVSATWIDQEGNEVAEIIRMAQRYDLVVLHTALGGSCGFSPGEAGEIILSRGGPVMLAGPRPPSVIARTIAIAWKNTPEAASALSAAMPLLYQAERIFVISVADNDDTVDPTLDNVVMRLRWHDLDVIADPIIARQLLPAACLMEHVGSLGADLLVMGAYGRNRLRELIFGSFTKQVLCGASVPVFLTH